LVQSSKSVFHAEYYKVFQVIQNKLWSSMHIWYRTPKYTKIGQTSRKILLLVVRNFQSRNYDNASQFLKHYLKGKIYMIFFGSFCANSDPCYFYLTIFRLWIDLQYLIDIDNLIKLIFIIIIIINLLLILIKVIDIQYLIYRQNWTIIGI
jgi:hypothetical protein